MSLVKLYTQPQGSSYISMERDGKERVIVCFNNRLENLKLKITPEAIMANCSCLVNLSCEYIVFLFVMYSVLHIEIIQNFRKIP